MTTQSWFIIALFAVGVALFVCYARTGKMLRCIFFTALTGLAAMGALWGMGHFLPIPLDATPFSLIASALLGIPGVVGMLVLLLL